MPGRIIPIPAAYNALDDDQYTTLAGVPTSSFLGRQCLSNDRCLAANARRAAAVCFPDADLPELFDYVGTDLGMWDVQATPGCEYAQIWLRLKLPAGGVGPPPTPGPTFRAVPYIHGKPFHGRSSADGLDMVGTTGAILNYGPITIRLPPGPQRVGVVVYAPTVDGGTITPIPSTGVQYPGCVVSASLGAAPVGSFSTLAAPYKAVLRYVDNNGARSDWSQIIGVEDHTVFVNPTFTIASAAARIWPILNPTSLSVISSIEWMPTETAYLYAMYCTEAVQTSLSSYDPPQGISAGGRGYIPLGDNAAYTGHPFMSMPWMIMASNNVHQIQTRQRHEILDRYRSVVLTNAWAEVARYVVDSATESDFMKLRAVFAVMTRSSMNITTDFSWRVTTQDTAGATSVGPIEYTHSFGGWRSADGFYGDDRTPPLEQTIRFAWPSDPYTMMQETTTPWQLFQHDSALPKRPRVVIVEAKAVFSQLVNNGLEAQFRGLSAVGVGV